jgi:hypothetical protein
MKSEEAIFRRKAAKKAWRKAYTSRPDVRDRIRIKANAARAKWSEEKIRRYKRYHKTYYALNTERLRLYAKLHGAINAEKKRNVSREWNRNPRNKAKIKARYLRNKKNPAFRIATSLRTYVRKKLVAQGAGKNTKTCHLIGCSFQQLRRYLEAKFLHGMSWTNYGVKGWHIDHIRPCASFDLTDAAQQAECFHYTNLQPLWAHQNWSKGSRTTKA